MVHPTTTIRAEPLTLSTKKERERRGDLFRRPPRLPPRTCPRPRSRIFPGREGELLKAQLVSFQAGERAATGTPLSSAAYDSDKVESYFDQAFVKEDEIGAGDFGRVFRVRSRVSLKRVILGDIWLLILVFPGGSKGVCSENSKRALQRPHRQDEKTGGGRKLGVVFLDCYVFVCLFILVPLMGQMAQVLLSSLIILIILFR